MINFDWDFHLDGESLIVSYQENVIFSVSEEQYPGICFADMDMNDLQQLLVDNHLDEIQLELKNIRDNRN